MANNTYTVTATIKGPYSTSAYAKAYGTTGIVSNPVGGSTYYWSWQVKANQSTYRYAVLAEFSDIVNETGVPLWNWVGGVLTPIKSSATQTVVWSRTFGDSGVTNVTTKCHIADQIVNSTDLATISRVYEAGGSSAFGSKTFSVVAKTVTPPATTTGTTKYEVVVGDGTNVVPAGNYDVYVPSAFTVSGVVVVGDGNAGSSTVTIKQGTYSSFSSGTVPATTIATITLTNVRVGAASTLTNTNVAAGSVIRITNTLATGFKRLCVAVYGS